MILIIKKINFRRNNLKVKKFHIEQITKWRFHQEIKLVEKLNKKFLFIQIQKKRDLLKKNINNIPYDH